MSENHSRPSCQRGPSPNASPSTTTSEVGMDGQYRWLRPEAGGQSLSESIVMGVDIGGTGIKGAPVDVDSGELAGERFRLLTPKPATPKSVADVVAQVVEHFEWKGPVGATFPAVVKNGVTMTAANVNSRWVGTDAEKVLTERLGSP